MNELIVLRISDNIYVDLNGVKLGSKNEVAEALEKLRAEIPNATVSIEADDPIHYEAIGKAIYGSHRAGFLGERFRILVDGQLLDA